MANLTVNILLIGLFSIICSTSLAYHKKEREHEQFQQERQVPEYPTLGNSIVAANDNYLTQHRENAYVGGYGASENYRNDNLQRPIQHEGSHVGHGASGNYGNDNFQRRVPQGGLHEAHGVSGNLRSEHHQHATQQHEGFSAGHGVSGNLRNENHQRPIGQHENLNAGHGVSGNLRNVNHQRPIGKHEGCNVNVEAEKYRNEGYLHNDYHHQNRRYRRNPMYQLNHELGVELSHKPSYHSNGHSLGESIQHQPSYNGNLGQQVVNKPSYPQRYDERKIQDRHHY